MSDNRVWLRNERFLPQWSQSSTLKNGAVHQSQLKSSVEAEQQVRPFYGPTQQRPAYENFDFYHRRATGHHTSLNQHMKLDLMLRLRTEEAMHGSGTEVAKLLRWQLDNYDNVRCAIPTALNVER